MKKTKSKMINKVISLAAVAFLIFASIGVMIGCNPNKHIFVKEKQRDYYKLKRGRDWIALVTLKDESLVVDGVVTIPEKVDGYKAKHFADLLPTLNCLVKSWIHDAIKNGT